MLEVLQARWRLFGHVLRREPSIPANKTVAFYFHDNGKRARGQPFLSQMPQSVSRFGLRANAPGWRGDVSLRVLGWPSRKWGASISTTLCDLRPTMGRYVFSLT
ncbi:hypothetical protein ElyMa_003414400 [Elysia marginata]|uniref:Uncharacterized protein n=1 Tax=Elysia marginata TaxID=1093978 RepID=A0AAV4JQH9_9GAST|nr:hypothetical protein ElyMa_003414400 [Elysia marginata]